MKKHHYIYKIINTINNRYYIGIHSTNNLDDGYFGSGTALRAAIRKDGKENFIKEIISHHSNRDEALKSEAEIVNHTFLKDKNTYNIAFGGGSVKVLRSKMKELYSEMGLFYVSSNTLNKDGIKVEYIPKWRNKDKRYLLCVDNEYLDYRDRYFNEFKKKLNANHLKFYELMNSVSSLNIINCSLSELYNDLNKEKQYNELLKILSSKECLEYFYFKELSINDYKNEISRLNQGYVARG